MDKKKTQVFVNPRGKLVLFSKKNKNKNKKQHHFEIVDEKSRLIKEALIGTLQFILCAFLY